MSRLKWFLVGAAFFTAVAGAAMYGNYGGAFSLYDPASNNTAKVDNTGAVLVSVGGGGGSSVAIVVADSTNANLVNPAAWPHTYGYTGTNLTTDSITNGVNTWVKTFGYTGSQLTSESGWVKQ